jgi:hypothetical protein
MATHVKIQTVTVGSGGATSIDFTSIPQTYTDLKIILSGRTSGGGASGQYITFNGSTSNFSGRYLYTSTETAPSSSTIARYIGTVMSTAQTANVFNNTEIYIPNYTLAINKSFTVDAGAENAGTYGGLNYVCGLWSSTAAITSISLAPDNGNYPQYSTATLYGILNGSPYATGGNRVYTDGTYWYHQFLATGTSAFVPTINLNVDYLVVAGGGGGGAGSNAGGGGAGGYRTGTLSVTANTSYTTTVGGGGPGGTVTASGTKGSDSVFGSITSDGGGFGAGTGKGNGGAGGSGGGAGYPSGTGGLATSGQGNNGGAGGTGAPAYSAGGGGGANSVGGTGTSSVGSGIGGNGLASSISGSSITRAGGGGAGNDTSTVQAGGTGGGGNGAAGGTTAATNGTVNTGGGGGGGSSSATGGTGGSGIVIIRYAV